MLRAYFDESGKLHDPNETVSAIGACIAPLAKWAQLEKEWKLVLADFKVTELHMKHLSHFRGEYQGWTVQDRENFLGRIIEIMNHYIDKYFGAMVPLEQFTQLPPEKQAELKDPYYMCLFDAIRTAWDIAWTLHEPHEFVEIICDENREVEKRASHVYSAMKENLDYGYLLTSFSFGNSKDIIPLQAADLVAYECLKLRRAMLDPAQNVIDNPRWPMGQLLRKNCNFEYYTLEDLSTRLGIV